ncbi:MAG: hypothetical protein C4332_01680 [Meiothermus sp.]
MSLLSFVGYGLASAPWMLYTVLVVTTLGAIDEPALQLLISQKVRDDEQGTVQGALATITNLMGVVGPIAGTYLFTGFSGPGTALELPGTPFFAGAVFVAVGLGLAYRTLRHQKAGQTVT